jgi:outer membrane protein OmpA-like peptidoglycan-associated protein
MTLIKSLSAALLVSGLIAMPVSAAFAQEQMTPEEIEQALKPKAKTRSLKPIAKTDSKQELDAILDRSIKVVDRKKIIEITEKAESPHLDFAINFGYDSADIDQNSFATLDSLANALKGNALQSSSFLVNGHTDAAGSEAYNDDLSQRRADAVVAYLVSRHDIDPTRLKAIGFGESNLKDTNDGESGVNRRVEIINRP